MRIKLKNKVIKYEENNNFFIVDFLRNFEKKFKKMEHEYHIYYI